MIELDKQDQLLKKFYSAIYRRYDLVNRLFTMGLDNRWRKRTANQCLKAPPKKLIDICCGTGDMILTISKRAPHGMRLVGYDFSEAMLGIARKKALRQGFSNIEFIQGNVFNMPFKNGEFDCITIAFGFRNLTFENPACDNNLAEIARILKQDGRLAILESAVPVNRIINFLYRIYLKIIIIPLGGLISGNWKAYRYLAKSAANFFSTDEITDLLRSQGLKPIYRRSFFLGASNLLIVVKD